MLSIETEARVAKILLSLAEGERSIEVSRQVLSDNYDFDPYQIFRALDSCCKNCVDTCDIINFLRTKGIYANEEEVNFLILSYDEDSNGTLSYSEFLNLVQSENSPKKNNAFSKMEKLSFNVEYSLSKLLEKEIDMARNIIPLLKDLKCRYDFNIHDIYHLVKSINSITPESLKCFLDRNCASYLETDINNIMKRLDINKDGRVDLCEFHSFFGFPECSNLGSSNVCCICGCCVCSCCDPCIRYCPPRNNYNNYNNVRVNREYNNNVSEPQNKPIEVNDNSNIDNKINNVDDNININNSNNNVDNNININDNNNINIMNDNNNININDNNNININKFNDVINVDNNMNDDIGDNKINNQNFMSSQKSTYFKSSGRGDMMNSQIPKFMIQTPFQEPLNQQFQTPINQSPQIPNQQIPNQQIPNQQTPIQQSPIQESQIPQNEYNNNFNQQNQNIINQMPPQNLSYNNNQNIQNDNNMFQDRKRISPNLSLRLSPERKYPPNYCCYCRCNPCCCVPICNPINNSSPITQLPLKNNNLNNMMNNNNFNNMNNNMMNNNNCPPYNPNELEECQLNEYLKELMNTENQLENIKIDLALKCDFNVEDAFRIFENCGRGYLTYEDLKCGLNLLDVYASDADIRLLMKRYDLQKNCSLNFSDFFDMIVPFEKDYRNMVENRSPNTYCPNNCPDVFMFGTRMALKNVFNALIDYENKLNCMRRNYTTLRLKLRDIFNLIDPCCTGAFKSEDLDNYLKKKCLFRNPKDEDLLFIRLDKNRDGKVDYCEFEDELQPQY